VLHSALRRGLRVPDDLSIIGFDDVHMAQVLFPPLTSIQMSRLDLARAAVTALRAHVEESAPMREYRIDTKLVVRESTDYPRGTGRDLPKMTTDRERELQKSRHKDHPRPQRTAD
jgi:DNA-binding LacI/PurR family transcriptional regulator